ncbi:MAG: 3-isopropylmalate dehydrogenase, partial [bacterium]|nr:3-isopropylmalate dehydrogenase [bacterium]
RVLERVASDHGFELSFDEAVVGGAAIDAVGDPLPAETLAACHAADAVLLGAVGGPKWSDPSAPVRPEQGLLRLRREFDLFANLRPVKVFPALAGHAPLRPDLLDSVDILFVRELTSGIYFGKSEEENASGVAYDTMSYSVSEVERIAHVAFAAARRRQGRVASVDKANVLASMRLWRRTVDRVAKEYSDVELEHVLVDACAMFLMRRPASFDVVLAGNCFGDILSDEAATLAGSLGLLPSASLGTGSFGVYEPIHGSAPDIAGQGIANPVATLLSAAMMLRYSFSLEEPARAIEEAVAAALDSGLRT